MPTRPVLVRALLTDSDNNPLSGRPVNLLYRPSGTSTWLDIGTNPHTTGADGYASDTININTPAIYDFRAEFPGDDDYDPSYMELDNQKIKGKTVITLTITPQ